MLEIVDNRTLENLQQVEVYRNLHVNKGKVFSIRDKKTGLVVARGNKFRIENVECKVREGGRKKVIREKKKNVHAFPIGLYSGECEMNTSQMIELYYNPYTTNSFINKETGEAVNEVDLIYFEDGKAYILKQ